MDRSLSLIEQLPGNLFDAIIDYVPESMHNLRLTSSTMKNLVDSYVFSVPNLVHRMEIMGVEEGEAPGTLRIAMEVQPEMVNRFELQLKLMCSRYVYPRELIRRDPPNGVSSMLVHRATATSADWQALVSSLKRTAHTTRTVDIEHCSDDPNRTMVWMFLCGVKMRKLVYRANRLNEEEIGNLHSLIRVHNVEMLSLCVKEIAVEDPAQLLLGLASRWPLQTLHLHQLPVDGVGKEEKQFLGKTDFDWAPTILAMFDCENELDKLCIENAAYPNFLTQGSITKLCETRLRLTKAEEVSHGSITNLCENLPNVGKEVWFECTLHLPSTDAFSSKINGHYVKAGGRFLSIKHASRVNEPLENF